MQSEIKNINWAKGVQMYMYTLEIIAGGIGHR